MTTMSNFGSKQMFLVSSQANFYVEKKKKYQHKANELILNNFTFTFYRFIIWIGNISMGPISEVLL